VAGSSATLGQRHAQLRAALRQRGAAALLVSTPNNIRYLTNHAGSSGALVVTADTMHLLVDFRYEEAVRQLQETAAACPSLQMWPVPASYDEAVVACVLEVGLNDVAFEGQHVSVARFDWLRRAFEARGATVALSPTQGLVEAGRAIKDAAEVALLREAGRRLGGVVEAAFGAIAAGRTEREVAGTIEAALRAAGYERTAFDTIVASGPHSALPHHRAGGRQLGRGELVVLDFGGVLDGYCCDLTRTVAVGDPGPERRRIHDAVREAQQAAIEAIRPGIMTSAVDAAARDVLVRHDLGEAFGHGTGHGLGLDVHEEPRLTRPRADVPPVPLEPGMVFTIEPGAYVPGLGGVRIEDDILVTDTGYEVLTSAPRELLTF